MENMENGGRKGLGELVASEAQGKGKVLRRKKLKKLGLKQKKPRRRLKKLAKRRGPPAEVEAEGSATLSAWLSPSVPRDHATQTSSAS